MQELNELKNLVIQSLEANGSLSNIRAQIRASVFKVIDQQEAPAGPQKKPSPFSWENPKCQRLLENEYGVTCLQIIKEFLSFYSMDYSNSVFSSESNLKEDIKRDKLSTQLGFEKYDSSKPILLQLLENKHQPKPQENIQAAPKIRQIEEAVPKQEKVSLENKDSPKQQPPIQKKEIEIKAENIQQQKQVPQQQIKQPQKLPQQQEQQQQQPEPKEVQNNNEVSKKKLENVEALSEQSKGKVIGSLPVNKNIQDQPSSKYDQAASRSYEKDNFDQEGEEDEGVEEHLSQFNYQDEDNYNEGEHLEGDEQYSRDPNHQFEESEDFIGQSSKGYDLSVDSYQLDEYDFVVNIEDI